ncbi:hypothetical protein [Sinomonas mesophila]|uniref:hypothetical protein n=1 Tax=Sinomonas mesophila TaxID=1531955 RepID=UPI0009850035|nr:hypothetical protein [Sinomonas mesophila]
METNRIGRPSLGRENTVAVKLPDAEMEKLREIGAILDIKPGRFASDHFIDFLRALDLDALRATRTQELPYAEAS